MNNIKRYQILYRLDSLVNYHNRNIDLIYNSGFELLISVLLSARTKDIQVNKVAKNLFQQANTPESMLTLGLEKIKKYIKCIGLFNSKATNIIRTCQILVNKYNSIIPNNRLDLESLPGVGRKTANIILNIIFNQPTIAVDTHVFRFCNRSRFAIGQTPLAVERKLIKVVPRKFKKKCHQFFVKHGRYICRSKNPYCSNCIIFDLCEFNKKNQKI